MVYRAQFRLSILQILPDPTLVGEWLQMSSRDIHILWSYYCIHILWSYYCIHILWSYSCIHILWSYYCIPILWSYNCMSPLLKVPRTGMAKVQDETSTQNMTRAGICKCLLNKIMSQPISSRCGCMDHGVNHHTSPKCGFLPRNKPFFCYRQLTDRALLYKIYRVIAVKTSWLLLLLLTTIF